MAAGEVLKLGFHCLGLLKQRWTPSQFYTKHCLLSPQTTEELEPVRIFHTPSWTDAGTFGQPSKDRFPTPLGKNLNPLIQPVHAHALGHTSF